MTSATFTASDRAELRDAIARSRIEAKEESNRLAAEHAAATRATRPSRKPTKRVTPPLLPVPVTAVAAKITRDDLTPPEQQAFDRLHAACNTESTIDVVTHAALVARVVVEARRKAQA